MLVDRLLQTYLISLVLLSPSLATATLSHKHRVRTPPHVLSQRRINHRRALLKAQLTIGSLLNVTLSDEVPEPSTTTSTTTTVSRMSTSSASPTSYSPSRPTGTTSSKSSTCFPFTSKGFSDGTVPTMSRKDWWCEDKEMYGFLGE